MSINSELELVADPIRLRLLRALGDQRSCSLQELAVAAEVHVNTVRPHLRELETGGMVVRESVPAEGRGRPAARYRLAEGWRLPSSDFRGLAELLAAVIARLAPNEAPLQAVGRQWGRYLLGRPGAPDVAAAIPHALERLGFDARLDDGTVVLSGCPCPLVMPGRPSLVCHLATAALSGMLETTGSDLEVVATEHDPLARRCFARLGRL
jgi:predicted ArsR family transcriptional regulator